MEQKEAFKAGLARLREKAAKNFNHITVGEILACFPDMELTRDQVRLIYQYAEEERIVIEDYKPHDTRSVPLGKKKLTGEEKETFRMYMSDLRGVRPCTPEEEMLLVERLLAGDDSAQSRLIEGNLHRVLEFARAHSGYGVLIGDLVQEGNLELMGAAADLLSGTASILEGGFEDYLKTRVDRALRALIEEQGAHDRAGQRMARETNRLLAVTMDLEEELGREATLSELSEKMKLPEDKVKELIRVSLNAAEFSSDEEKK